MIHYPEVKTYFKIAAYLSLLFLISVYILMPTSKENYNVKQGYKWERYDPKLALSLKSIDDILTYTDQVSGTADRHSLAYVQCLQDVLAIRFFHGYSYYSLHQNWISFLAGKLIWSDLNAIVSSKDILLHPYAACSQVSIVFSDCLKKIGVSYRKVTLKGHFVLEASVNSKWYLLDANLEPSFPHGIKSVAELKASNELIEAYKGHKTDAEIISIFSKIGYGKENASIAPVTFLFQKTTMFLSALIAVFLLIYVTYDLCMHLLNNQNRIKEHKLYQFLRYQLIKAS